MELRAAVRRLERPQSSLPHGPGGAGVSNRRQTEAARHDGAERAGRLLAKVWPDRQCDEANGIHEGPDAHGEHHKRRGDTRKWLNSRKKIISKPVIIK